MVEPCREVAQGRTQRQRPAENALLQQADPIDERPQLGPDERKGRHELTNVHQNQEAPNSQPQSKGPSLGHSGACKGQRRNGSQKG